MANTHNRQARSNDVSQKSTGIAGPDWTTGRAKEMGMRDENRAQKAKPWYLLLIVSQEVAAEKIAGTGLL